MIGDVNDVRRIYTVLLRAYGPRRWWPTALPGDDAPSYHGKRMDDRQRFEVIVGTILTQNTSWKNADKAIRSLIHAGALDAGKLRRMSSRRLASLIRSSGYYNQKAERLKLVSAYFAENFRRFRKKSGAEETVRLREELLHLKGIGPETADSILLYAFQKPVFVVDAYTRRIFHRLGLCREDASYGELQDLFHRSLPRDQRLFNEYHALLVEHAKRHCSKSPLCSSCPLGGGTVSNC
jgi:endonuclease-3 related protein